MSKFKKVYITTDDVGHWYVIPFELKDKFEWANNLGDTQEGWQEMDNFYKYRTGGAMDLKHDFYIKVEGCDE